MKQGKLWKKIKAYGLSIRLPLAAIVIVLGAVSYTHLDVYKRQIENIREIYEQLRGK